MLKIAVGTTSQYKINAISKVIYDLDIEHELFPFEVSSGISEQPHSQGETESGSVNRAKAALSASNDCEIGLGVEFGYEPYSSEENRVSYRMHCWTSIVDRSGKVISEHSSSLTLPKQLQVALESNIDVSSQLDEFYKLLPTKKYGRHFQEYLRKRRFIYESIESAVLRYVLRELY